jgi:hypothetical protein
MPNPYRQTGQVSFRGNPLLERPGIAIAVAQSIAAFAKAEAMLANVYAKALRIDEAIAIDVYLVLATEGPKKSAYEAVISKRVLPGARQKLTEMQLELRTWKSWRNDFAHGVWALASDEPDHILNANSADVMRYFRQIMTLSPAEVESVTLPALVYTQGEIEQCQTALNLAGEALRFSRAV